MSDRYGAIYVVITEGILDWIEEIGDEENNPVHASGNCDGIVFLDRWAGWLHVGLYYIRVKRYVCWIRLQHELM